MAFEKLHDIVKVGYDDARTQLAAWKESGVLEKVIHV